MLLSIKRVYIDSGEEVEVLLNSNYIIKIEPCNDSTKPKTRIVMYGFGEPSFAYTNETITTIRTKLTKARNKKQEDE